MEFIQQWLRILLIMIEILQTLIKLIERLSDFLIEDEKKKDMNSLNPE